VWGRYGGRGYGGMGCGRRCHAQLCGGLWHCASVGRGLDSRCGSACVFACECARVSLRECRVPVCHALSALRSGSVYAYTTQHTTHNTQHTTHNTQHTPNATRHPHAHASYRMATRTLVTGLRYQCICRLYSSFALTPPPCLPLAVSSGSPRGKGGRAAGGGVHEHEAPLWAKFDAMALPAPMCNFAACVI